jgi:acetate---CoA ligase (ADP-forming)
MHSVSPSLPAVDTAVAPILVLRDGSVATIRPSSLADVPALRQFFHDLSSESRYRRFFSAGEAPDAVIERLSDSTHPARNLTLVAERSVDGAVRIVAAASYTAVNSDCAEAAFAVADTFQGKGLGTLLLERLAVLAERAGIRRFQATTLASNTQMLEVFRESGFEIRSKLAGSAVDVEFALASSVASVAAGEKRQRIATAASLRPLFEPQAVAVIGASRDASHIGRRVLDSLIAAGYRGHVYPVNPHTTEIAGLKTFGSTRDLPAGVDLAVVAVPAPSVGQVVDDCAAAGVKALVVVTAGFAEAGIEGRARQAQLLEQTRSYGMRLVGPNCMGLLNTDPAIRLNASFSAVFPPSGHIGLLSQSGALGLTILELAVARHLGLSTFVSVGNKADVSGNDLLQYWEADPQTSVILLYLESFGNPRRFARLARRIGRQKPIIAVKAGRTRAGSRAAGSHTAALAASDAAVDAMFRQSGVIRADTIDEMFDVAAGLDTQPLPVGRRVAIVTNAGGPGILAVDACEAAGLSVPPFSAETRGALAAFLPSEASVGNPVDMVASAGPAEFRRAVEVALSAPDTDALIVVYTPVDTTSADVTLEAICDGILAGRRHGASAKPIVACLMASARGAKPLEAGDERVPVYAFPENAARALAKAASYAELFWSFDDIHADDARAVCRRALDARGPGWLTGDEVRAVLGAFALPLAPGTIAHSADDAAALAQAIGFPVVAKLSARAIPHKSDIGGVRVNLTSDQAVRRAFTDIMAAARTIATDGQIEGVLVQSMVSGGVETIIGVADDPVFGPVVAFGLGGIHVEVLGDVRFRIAPLTDADADALVQEIRGLPLLQGYRGHPAADLHALRDVLLRVSRLAIEVPEIAELDLNPVIALAPGLGCRIVDARVRVH